MFGGIDFLHTVTCYFEINRDATSRPPRFHSIATTGVAKSVTEGKETMFSIE
jgi:hypothetical protein